MAKSDLAKNLWLALDVNLYHHKASRGDANAKMKLESTLEKLKIY